MILRRRPVAKNAVLARTMIKRQNLVANNAVLAHTTISLRRLVAKNAVPASTVAKQVKRRQPVVKSASVTTLTSQSTEVLVMNIHSVKILKE